MLTIDYLNERGSVRGLVFYRYKHNDTGIASIITISGFGGTTYLSSDTPISWQEAIGKRVEVDAFFGWLFKVYTPDVGCVIPMWGNDDCYYVNGHKVGHIIKHVFESGTTKYVGFVDGLLADDYNTDHEAIRAVEKTISNWLIKVCDDIINSSSVNMSPEWLDFKYRVLPQVGKANIINSDGVEMELNVASYCEDDLDLHGLNQMPGSSPQTSDLPGYHVADIKKGELGESTKIKEEVEEFLDAIDQGSSIMALVELSDVIGAIEAYLATHHPEMSLDDLKKFSEITKRAFVNGHRA